MTNLQKITHILADSTKAQIVNTVGLIVLSRYAAELAKREEDEDEEEKDPKLTDIAWDASYRTAETVQEILDIHTIISKERGVE